MSSQLSDSPDSAVLERPKLKKPSMWKAVLINDNSTPFQAVIAILMEYFDKPFREAESLTRYVHKNGRGVAGIYTKEVAEHKCHMAMQAVHNLGFIEFSMVVEPE